MDRIPKHIVDRLDLVGAVESEANSRATLLPVEPWRPSVIAKKEQVAAWVAGQLRTGSVNAPGLVVGARKLRHGSRPLSVLGIAERVAYRALTDWIVSSLNLPGRTVDTHREFIAGPIDDERTMHPPGPVTVESIRNKYVVESDISAFYEYVDHEKLRVELEMWSGKFEEVDGLMQFLVEIQGKAFGIPQPAIASDGLSEVYAQCIERDLIRQGLKVWRFNDDFRMACETYEDALDAIDRLVEAARRMGLSINEYKTLTLGFTKYLTRHSSHDWTNEVSEFDLSDFEVSEDVDYGYGVSVEDLARAEA